MYVEVERRESWLSGAVPRQTVLLTCVRPKLIPPSPTAAWTHRVSWTASARMMSSS